MPTLFAFSKRLLLDLASVSCILFVIGSAYFFSAQRVLYSRAQGYTMCTNMEKVHKDLSHLKERYAKISESSMKDDIKVDLMKRHLVAIMDLESEVKTCEGE